VTDYTRNYIPQYAPGSNAPVAAWIGDVLIDDEFVHTPVGDMLRTQTRWQVGDTTPQPQRIPGWAVACAILLFLCMGPFSLLFLLAKEDCGQVTSVRLTDGRRTHVAQVGIADQNDYRVMLQTIEWAERALPERRALES
jgi:hypothetical protein